jgi:phosphomannomutase
MSVPAPIHFGTDGWRAVIGDDFTYPNVRRVADAAGRVFAADHPGGTIVVGFDTRFEASGFAEAAAEVLASHGLRVRESDAYCPTPALCWTVARDEAAVGGVMLTASHNPAAYLGVKLRMADGGASPVAFTARVEAEMRDEEPAARGAFERFDLMGPYLADLADFVDGDAIRAAGLKVVVDPLYGAGRVHLAGVLRGFGVDVT